MAVSTFLIPLDGVSQTLSTTIAGVTYTLTVKWNDSEQSGWVMDIADASQVPIASCLPLVTGIDLLSGLEYLGINASMFVQTDGDLTAVPTFTNLGTDCNLYFDVVT